MSAPFDALLKWCEPPPSGGSWHYCSYWNVLVETNTRIWLETIYNGEVSKLLPEKRPYAHYLFMASVRMQMALDQEDSFQSVMHSLSIAKIIADDFNADYFQLICRQRWSEIWRDANSRSVQISKLGRNSLIAPLIAEILRVDSRQPVFVDTGSSLGFGMLWPYLRYRDELHLAYQGGLSNHESPELLCNFEGFSQPPLGGILPVPIQQIGIEIDTVSIDCALDMLWLASLIGPNDALGFHNFLTGITLLMSHGHQILKGCALNLLPKILGTVSYDSPIIINHAMIEHHLDQDGKLDAWDRLLREAALVRPFWETGIEWARLDNGVRPRPVEVYLRRWEGGRQLTLILGHSDASASGYFFRRI